MTTTSQAHLKRASYRDKRVIAAGGSRGIGMEVVQSLLNEGATVATCELGAEALEAIVDGCALKTVNFWMIKGLAR